MTREEAINEIKSWAIPSEKGREVLETLIPELTESEDERIRKELKEAFEAYDIESKWNGIPIRSIFAWLEKQKEQEPVVTHGETYRVDTLGTQQVIAGKMPQKPIECIEFDNEFEKQVSHLLASVLNGEWEYNEGFVKHAAQSLLGYAKHELKQELPLMGGDTDAYFDDLRITTKPLTSREWFNEGIKYAQRLQQEQKHKLLPLWWIPKCGTLSVVLCCL